MEYQCPECKSYKLNVVVCVTAKLLQNEGNFETEFDGGDHEWGSESSMLCEDCNHCARAGDFAVEDEEEEAIDPVYRVFPEGDVIALWGEKDRLGRISSYMYIGQHSDASPALIDELEPASIEQAQAMRTTLEECLGYIIK